MRRWLSSLPSQAVGLTWRSLMSLREMSRASHQSTSRMEQQMTDAPSTDLQHLRLQSMELLESLDPMLDMLDGFRSNLKKRGWSDEATEYMTITLFNMAMGVNHDDKE